MLKSSRFFTLISTLCLTLAAGMPTAMADDTEIYLGKQNGNAIKHNILFILDTSFSMRNDVKEDKNGDGDTNDPGENLGSRISILQDAMSSIINGLDNVRVGLMRMNGAESPTKPGTALACNATLLAADGQTYINGNVDASNTGKSGVSRPQWGSACYVPTGGSVLFPISDIDADISTVAGETAKFNLVVPLASGSDDAVQLRSIGTSTVISDPILNLAHNSCPAASVVTNTYTISTLSSSDDVEEVAGSITPASSIDIGTNPTGFRFQNVIIPDNAAILSSTITFTANAGGTEDLNLSISGGVNADSANTFVNIGGQKVSDRVTTLETTSWTGVQAATTGATIVTPDLSAVVQELVNDAANWDETGDSLVFLIDNAPGNTGRNVHDVSSDPSKVASLEIKHCNTVVPVPPSASRNFIGLRFQNVGVPQGAKIKSAYIDFVAANPVSNVNLNNGVDDDVHIHGELNSNPATFADGVQFSNRTLTPHPSVSVDWEGDDMGVWVEGNTYTTPDLDDIVEKIVDLPSWCGGNNMAFIIEGDANLLVRAFSAYEDDPAKAPVLRIQYENSFSGSDTGCNVRSYSIPIAQSNHDARTNSNTTTVNTTSGGMPMGSSGITFNNFFNITVGLIFNVPVLEDTVINSARLEFTATNNATEGSPANSELIVNAEASLNAANFSTSNFDLDPSTRSRISGTGIPINWSQPPVANNAKFGVDVTPLVKAVTAQSGWAYDNQMAFFISDGATPLLRQADSYDGSPSTAPRLILNVQENTATITAKTVRERLLEINETFTIPNLLGWTPSVETLYEAARYWRGKGVVYGKSRGAALIDGDGVVENVLIGTAQNPDLYQDMDYKLLMHRTLTSHPGSYTGGNYNDAPGGDKCEFSHDPSCVQDSISGSPVYISPIDTGLECAGNFQIFLTDGAPTFTNDATVDLITSEFADINSCVANDPSINAKGNQGRCAVEMAASLRNNDQSVLHDGDQTITSYTIAFNLNDTKGVNWLKQIASAGDGQFYSANSAADLLSVFGQIFNDIVQRPTSFVAPSIAANAFNRLFSRNEVYFGLFEPNQLTRWDGNIKKYNICDNPDPDGIPGNSDDCTLGDVLDANGVAAVGADGLFKGEEGQANAAKSEWSNIADGKTIRSGGAGGEITNVNQRVIYTELDANGALTSSTLDTDGYKITSSNWSSTAAPDLSHIHNAVCPNSPGDLSAGSDCSDRMQWMLGTDIQDEDGDLNTSELRWWFPDVLHSSPIAVTYGVDQKGTPLDTSDDEFIDKILVGTNDGGLHMINGTSDNTSGGVEEWVFIPNADLAKQPTLYDNNTGGHTYGLDTTPVVRIIDRNNNGIIEPNATPSLSDKVIVYIAQRRGGNTIYALDLTPVSTLTTVSARVEPKFLWSKTLSAQSWSEPALARIQTTNGTISVEKDVLVFGGGYDVDLDANYGLAAGAPNDGNSIFIVDADSGDTIIEISNDANAGKGITASGAHIEVPDMYYSIPSNITIFDSNGDGLEDRIYVGDMGGQVWRVDLGSDIKFVDDGSPATNLPGSTVVGKLASIATDGGTPAITSEERRFFYKPAVVQVIDTVFSNANGGKFDYIIIPSGDRASPVDRPVQDRIYAFRDLTISTMAGTGNLATAYPDGTTLNAPITAGDMIDVTAQVLSSTDPAHRSSMGWYYSFDVDASANGNTGEKGLAAPTVIAGTLITTSYVPDDPSLATACGAVEGSGKAYNFNILNAGASLDWDGTPGLNSLTDRVSTLGAGIPSEAVPIFTKEGVTVLVGTGGGAENLGTAASLPRYRTYWAEQLPSS